MCWFELLSHSFSPKSSVLLDSIFLSSPFYKKLFQQSLLTYFWSDFKLVKFCSPSTRLWLCALEIFYGGHNDTVFLSVL